MNEGYFIGLNDKTTCGGKVLDGDTRVMMYGVAHACEGDRVTCGEDGETYRIVGGVSHIISHGKHVAGTLDSYSSELGGKGGEFAGEKIYEVQLP